VKGDFRAHGEKAEEEFHSENISGGHSSGQKVSPLPLLEKVLFHQTLSLIFYLKGDDGGLNSR